MNIRHSSPDTYRKLQLPLGKRELPSTPLLLKQGETLGSAPGTRLQRQRGAG